MYLVTAKQMQDMDKKTIEEYGILGCILMENAGRSATEILLNNFNIKNKKITIIAGRGNNGGDGFVIARYLAQNGTISHVYLLSKKEKIKGDAAANLNLLYPINVPVIEIEDEKAFLKYKYELEKTDIWIDAIFGTGLKSDVKGFYYDIIEFINNQNKPIFSVDIASGLNSDTGLPCGISINADVTATFAYPKLGHVLLPGCKYTGKLEVIDIGIPKHIAKDVAPNHKLLTHELITNLFKKRSQNYHKGDAGHLLVLAGSIGKTGAAFLCSMSAMHTGAGLVTLAIPESLNLALETLAPEVMTLPLNETKDKFLSKTCYEKILDNCKGKRCLAIGPGIGTDDDTIDLIFKIIKNIDIPLVIDADGLNCISQNVNILNKAKSKIILTPHPGEMARLTGLETKEIQNNRIKIAKDFSKKYNVYIVLKGAKTIIATPEGKIYINPTGNPGMASGGMGDVLTGIIAALVTQGYCLIDSAIIGVYLHGKAADTLEKKIGPIGYLASDVMKDIPKEISYFI